MHVAKADCCQHAAGFPNLVLMLAQLRDSLTAEDSPVVSQEDNEGGVPLPQRAETNFTAASFRQHNVHELCTHRSCHPPIIWDKWLVPLIPKEPSGGPSFCASRKGADSALPLLQIFIHHMHFE